MNGKPNIHFKDNTPLKKVEEAIYLGVTLNERMNIGKEIQQRISNTIKSWKMLGGYWKHSNCTTRDKLNVYDAIVRSKLLYGLESAQLTIAQLNKINTVQLKGLRQILNMTTTFVNRANTNTKVIEKAQDCQKDGKTIKLFSEYYQHQRGKLIGHLIRQCDDDKEKFAAFQPEVPYPKKKPNRRVGKP